MTVTNVSLLTAKLCSNSCASFLRLLRLPRLIPRWPQPLSSVGLQALVAPFERIPVAPPVVHVVPPRGERVHSLFGAPADPGPQVPQVGPRGGGRVADQERRAARRHTGSAPAGKSGQRRGRQVGGGGQIGDERHPPGAAAMAPSCPTGPTVGRIPTRVTGGLDASGLAADYAEGQGQGEGRRAGIRLLRNPDARRTEHLTSRHRP